MAIDRDVSLSARADQGSAQFYLRRVVDVVKINTVVVANKNMVAAESQIRVGRTVLNRRRPWRLTWLRGLGGARHNRICNEIARGEARWLGNGGKLFHPEDGFAGVIQSGLKS